MAWLVSPLVARSGEQATLTWEEYVSCESLPVTSNQAISCQYKVTVLKITHLRCNSLSTSFIPNVGIE